MPTRKSPAVRRCKFPRGGLAWLELVLAILVLLFFVQLLPLLQPALDFRAWSRTTFILANVFVLLALVAVKALPGIVSDLQLSRKQSKSKFQKAERARQRKQQREAMERRRESLARRKF